MIAADDRWQESIESTALDCVRVEMAEYPELHGRPIVVTVAIAECQLRLRERLRMMTRPRHNDRCRR